MADTKRGGASAVQRAWLIDEVARNILAHVPSVGCARTLASCARVSSALSEPALDMLWCRMVDLSPLCRLLPEDEGEDDDDGRPSAGDGDIHVSSPPRAEDVRWACFRRYARRVRKLHYYCREGPSERVAHRTFAALVRRAARTGTPVLPRLEELSWLQSSWDVTPYVHFLSPSLRRVTVYVLAGAVPPRTPADGARQDRAQGGGPNVAGLFSVLDAQSPDVEELSLEGIELPASLEPLLAFKRLRNLRLGTVTAPSPASHAPHAALSHQRPGADATLQNLQDLRVIGAPAPIEALLTAVHADSPLRSVVLSVSVSEHDHHPDGAAAAPHCVALLAARFPATLCAVRVHWHVGRALPGIPPAVAGHAQTATFAHYVRPLLALRGMCECMIAVSGETAAGPEMSDEDVRAMAGAWPGLRVLEIALREGPAVSAGAGEGGASGARLPSVYSLEAFARQCPELVSLRLPVRQEAGAALDEPAPGVGDAAEGWDAASGVGGGHGHGLREVWLAGAWFSREESGRVRRFFGRTFPRADLRPMVSAGVL
ncbi:hypothetical protein BC628DRAFT_1501746 [Trametes gibbosa]|nr:hypothetical protein BC628DRAFT_1505006 [Trametes gibbosa]KAI0828125.1 hypothetical protein BC628DRAFT_1501746 [Trametes gibbosa]